MPESIKQELFNALLNDKTVDRAWQILDDFRASLPQFRRLEDLRNDARKLGMKDVIFKSRETLIKYIHENSEKQVQQSPEQSSG